MKKKLTIMIPCRERRTTLPRIMEYYGQYPQYDYIIYDSSKESYAGKIKENFKYIYKPQHKFYTFIFEVLSQIETEYVINVDDDDFLLLNNIEKYIEFLDNNKEYIAAYGQFGGIYDDIISYDTLSYYYHYKKNCESNEPLERAEYCWKYFEARNHDVYRTEVLRNIYGNIYSKDSMIPVRFVDKIVSFLAAYYGKIKVVHELYLLRSAETKTTPFQGRYIVNDRTVQEELRTDLHFEKHFLDFENDKILSEITNFSLEEIRKLYYGFVNSDKQNQYKSLSKNEQYGPMYNTVLDGYKIYPCQHYEGYTNIQENIIEEYKEYYPIFKYSNLLELQKIIRIIGECPLEKWW